ncbi:MAG: hypothetical protein LBM78_04040, partial [Clostridiales bacterium]|jgi:hypothetical protein|nr:hypothetical protein [Clostridiales bacterium]
MFVALLLWILLAGCAQQTGQPKQVDETPEYQPTVYIIDYQHLRYAMHMSIDGETNNTEKLFLSYFYTDYGLGTGYDRQERFDNFFRARNPQDGEWVYYPDVNKDEYIVFKFRNF